MIFTNGKSLNLAAYAAKEVFPAPSGPSSNIEWTEFYFPFLTYSIDYYKILIIFKWFYP